MFRLLALAPLVWALSSPVLESDAHAGVAIVISGADPYSAGWVPAARDGWVWVPGAMDPYGQFVPGYWQPVAPMVGNAWVPGRWVGHGYYDGYWRPMARPNQAWVDGYYYNHRYVAPRWVAEDRADHYRAVNNARIEAAEHRR